MAYPPCCESNRPWYVWLTVLWQISVRGQDHLVINWAADNEKVTLGFPFPVKHPMTKEKKTKTMSVNKRTNKRKPPDQ